MRAMKKSNQEGLMRLASTVQNKFRKGQGKGGKRMGNGKMLAGKGHGKGGKRMGNGKMLAGKGQGKGGKLRGKAKAGGGGTWMFVPNRGPPMAFAAKGHGKSKKPSGGGKVKLHNKGKKNKQNLLAVAKTGFAKRNAQKSQQKVLGIAKNGFAKRNGKKQAGKPMRGDPKIREKLDKIDSELKVWVGGLKTETRYGALRKHFAEAGHKTHLVNLTGKDRACLSFKTAEEASDAIAAMNGKELDGASLQVDVWTQVSKEDRAARREESKLRRKAAKDAKKAEKAA